MPSQKSQLGFTLLEIILVLALIASIASVILPNLRISVDSQMSISIRNLSSQIRAAYDNAVLSGRMQRMVVNISTGEYWVEQAPSDFNGRPPLFQDENNKSTSVESNKKTFLEMINEKEKNLSKRALEGSTQDNPQYYAIRSIPVIQKKVFMTLKWIEINDSIISKKNLGSDVVFAKFISGLSSTPYEYAATTSISSSSKDKFGYIYFLSDGSVTPTSIQLGTKNKNNMVAENDLKYTLNINTLTGQIDLSEGFQDANFKLFKK